MLILKTLLLAAEKTGGIRLRLRPLLRLPLRPLLARDAYEGVQKRAEVDRNDVLFFNDFLAYDHVNQLLPLAEAASPLFQL